MDVHPEFKFQGKNVGLDKLLDLVQSLDEPSFKFLDDWFNEYEFVMAQTSGSTGTPKRIKLQKKHMIASARATGTYFNCLEGTKALICLSADFIAGKMMWVRALTLGWDVYLSPPSGNPLGNNTIAYDFAAMVPLQVAESLQQLDRVKKLIVGGAPVSEALHSKLQGLSTQVYATYGMTETITHIAVKQLNHASGKEHYFEALPNVCISLDERGCLVIDAPRISAGKVVTNDLVKLHSENTFEWIGRYDSIINSGGVKLVPESIERKLQPFISERFFISSLADVKLGERVVLIIESLKENTILQTLKASAILDKYENPKEVYFVSEFKETPSAKIDKKATLKLIKRTC